MSQRVSHHHSVLNTNIRPECFVSLRGPAEGRGDGYENPGDDHCCPPHQCSQTGELQSRRCSEQGSEKKASAHTHTNQSFKKKKETTQFI